MEKMELGTTDITQENIEKIATLFPDAITESLDAEGNVQRSIDFDALRQNLSGDIVEGARERYQFTWPGKQAAKLEARKPINKTLRPVREKSINWDSTENLYIEGDNLEALKIMRETYAGKVKLIYIDPPYNTGHDFVYDDDFAQTHAEYDLESGEYDDEGGRLVANTEGNGRFHSDWCSMMYPRLAIARDLLASDGLIFVSINDYEHVNLLKMLENIFGADNFVEDYVWESTFRPDNSSPIYRKNAEFISCFAKNKKSISRLIGDREKSEGLPSLTKNSMKVSTLHFEAGVVKTYLEDGFYPAGDRGSYVLENEVKVRNGLIASPFNLTGRVIWGQEYLDKQLSLGTEIIIKNDSFVPYTKKNSETIHSPLKLIPKSRVGDVLKANAERDKLFSTKVFDYPKPVSLIGYLLSYIDDKDAIVLDFFSGSGTTAQAVLELNAQDSGSRKFILVQLPEQCSGGSAACAAGYETICDVGEERIRRAGKNLVKEIEESNQQPELDKERKSVPDIGFRVLRVDSSNFRDTLAKPEALDQSSIFDYVDNLKEGRTSEDLLFQVLPKFRIPYSAKIEEVELAGKTCFVVEDGQLVACFDPEVGVETIEAIAKMQPLYAVMRDASMADDSTFANFEELFKTYSPDTVRRVI